MRVLVLINRYPPHHLGGYELRFQEIVEGLRARGHESTVLCSSAGMPGRAIDAEGVRRELTLPGEVHGLRGVLRLARIALWEAKALRRAVRDVRPEVVLIGNFSGLCTSLFNTLAASRLPVVLDVSNEWIFELLETHGNWFRIFEKPSRSRIRGAVKGVARLLLRPGPRALRTRWPGFRAAAVYATAAHLVARLQAAHETGALPAPRLCRSGIALDDFPFAVTSGDPHRLLFVGRMKATKGLPTVLRALERLPPGFHLTAVGTPDDPAHEREVRERAGAPGLRGRVTFAPPVVRTEMAGLFHDHGVLLFPSEWEEAFSRLVLEAMACGAVVVGTPNGGTKEVLLDGVTGLLFPAGDAAGLARCLSRLTAEPSTLEHLRFAARRVVEEQYSAEAMVARIEAVLREAAGGAP
jgi:glycosyltransferase involved in cell wall biosynthesis